MIIIAIDPGRSGGIALLKDGRVHLYKMPDTPRDTCDILEAAQRDSLGSTFDASAAPSIRCYVERVGGYIGGRGAKEDGHGGQPGSAMFNFGAGYGVILGILTALKVPFELVTPQVWQKGLGLGTKGLLRPTLVPTMSKDERRVELKRVSLLNGKIKSAWKNKLKALAQQLYPGAHTTLKTCDALLLLEYARRRERIETAKPPQQSLDI